MEAYADSMVYIGMDLTSTALGNPGDQFLSAFDVDMPVPKLAQQSYGFLYTCIWHHG